MGWRGFFPIFFRHFWLVDLQKTGCPEKAEFFSWWFLPGGCGPPCGWGSSGWHQPQRLSDLPPGPQDAGFPTLNLEKCHWNPGASVRFHAYPTPERLETIPIQILPFKPLNKDLLFFPVHPFPRIAQVKTQVFFQSGGCFVQLYKWHLQQSDTSCLEYVVSKVSFNLHHFCLNDGLYSFDNIFI